MIEINIVKGERNCWEVCWNALRPWTWFG